MTTDYRGGRRGVERVNVVRRLRREATQAERLLWSRLRPPEWSGPKFRRQHEFGPYILDFYCPTKRLAIEVDGGQHFEPEGQAADGVRTQYLVAHGIRVLRFTNLEVLREFEGVMAQILETIEDTPSP